MTDKQQEANPYAYGYARMPRIIRKGYKNLTKLQKLLYIYIRDLCGEDGTCFRSLRSLQQETGFSIGYLSENIPILHNEDLIHAEMRKHQGSGWEIWHITIVDIWEKNATFLRTEKEKRSQDEQIEMESVHGMNKSVHQMNSLEAKCSPDERSVHAMTLNKNNKELLITKNNDRENIASTDASHASQEATIDYLRRIRHEGDEQEQGESLQALQAGLIESGVLTQSDAHPRSEYRARPGLSEHPDDQLPGKYWPEDDDPDKTVKVPVVSKQNTPTTPPAQAPSPQSEQVAPGSAHSARDTREPAPQAPAQAAESAAKGKGKKPVEPKSETSKSPPAEPASDMAWGTRKCLLWFDYWRGGILIGKFKLMQASTCAKGLAEQFSEQQVIQARTDMEADPYYVAKGGCDVCDVANNIHKYLKRKQSGQKPGSAAPVIQAAKRFSSYDDPNFRSDQDFYPVEGGSYAAASF